MKIVKILGKDYSLLWTEEDDLYGDCSQRHCRIRVSTNPDIQQQRDTLWHEVLHACEAEMDVKISETAIRRLATCSLQVLRDNTRLRDFLFEK